ncbi:MAG: hypothetical protein O2810_03465 [Bacteroidetes bacterium]|nr:hypothetical protein [Bacteroidota bacterium]MDA1084573.1 hypothetical protein [Bacteroidota bacterium]
MNKSPTSASLPVGRQVIRKLTGGKEKIKIKFTIMPNRKCEKCDKVNSEISKYCSQCGYELPRNEPIKMEEPKKNSKPEKKRSKFFHC